MTLPIRRRKLPKFENKTVIHNSIDYSLKNCNAPYPYNMSMPPSQTEVSYNQWVVPDMDVQDLDTKKEFIINHPLFSPMLKLLEDCRKEGYLGQMQIPQILKTNELNLENYSIIGFLEDNNITNSDLDAYPKEVNVEEFSSKLSQLRNRYSEELEKLKNVCHEFKERLLFVLQEQSTYRPVLEEEVELKTRLMNQKFHFILSQLKKNVCSAIMVLMKQYDCPRKKRRQLSKNATEILNAWFMDHIKDPYPNDTEKQELALKCGLSVSQVNNWFGNKRIRTKRKHPELANIMSKDSKETNEQENLDSQNFELDTELFDSHPKKLNETCK